jgi:hypothetical protein
VVELDRRLGSPGVRPLHHPEPVAVGIAEGEHRRDEIAHPHDGGVDVDAPRLQRRMVRVRVKLTSEPAGAPSREGTSAMVVAPSGGATSTQRPPSPKGPSMRLSNPRVPT